MVGETPSLVNFSNAASQKIRKTDPTRMTSTRFLRASAALRAPFTSGATKVRTYGRPACGLVPARACIILLVCQRDLPPPWVGGAFAVVWCQPTALPPLVFSVRRPHFKHGWRAQDAGGSRIAAPRTGGETAAPVRRALLSSLV